MPQAVDDCVIEVARRIAERSLGTDSGVGSAVRFVETCVESFCESVWPDVVWRFSGLSTDGSPLQFAFSTADSTLRYTTEVAGPEAAAPTRLARAVDLAVRLTGAKAPGKRLRAWGTLQSAASLRWGAWLGVRHDGVRARTKIYIEVPRDVREATSIVRGRGIVPVVPSSRLMMIGYDCESQSEEYYFRQPQMDRAELSAFLGFARRAPGGDAVLAEFADLCALPLGAALHWTNFGYSIPASAAGAGFAMFVQARSLQSAADISQKFLQREVKAAGEVSAYRRCIGTFADDRLPDHEIVSLIGRENGEVDMRVGVSAYALARP